MMSITLSPLQGAIRGIALTLAIASAMFAVAGSAKEHSISRDGFTLVLREEVAEPDEAYADLLIDGFFKIYPVIVDRYNRDAPRKVIVTVSDDYEDIGGIGHWADGGGGRAGNEIRIKNSMRKFSEVHSELRVFTHELMHLAQTYRSTAPSWLLEGIADYVSMEIRPVDDGGRLFLPPPPEDGSYRLGYGWAARFFRMLEKGYPGLVRELHWAAADGTYSDSTWVDLTGHPLDELWNAYMVVDGPEATNYRYFRPSREQLEKFKTQIAATENGVEKGVLPPSILEIQRKNLAIMEANLARREARTRGSDHREDGAGGIDRSSRDD